MALGTPGFSNIDGGGGGGGGSGVPLNFSQTKGAQVTITALEAKPATVVSTTITTAGNPVQIIVSGDANPTAAGGWGLLNIYRGGTAVGQLVQFESSAGNENVPYCLEVVDEPAAGTWTYSLKVTSVTTDTQFGEAAGPIITVVELGAVGTAAPSGAAGGDLGGTYPNPDVVAIQGYSVSTTAPASGEALVWDGSVWVPTAVSTGGAAGAANEIQYNDGSNALTASSGLTFDGTTLAINSIGPSALTVSSTIDGQFLDVNTSLYQLTLLDPTQLPLNVNATLGPSDLAIFDDNVSQSGNVQAGLVGVFDNATTNNLKMIIPAGVATIKSEDALSSPQALNLSIGELQVNTDPGTSGYVLTSNGAGAAPTWEAPQVNQSLYVAEGADPAVANGSPAFPYATISAAMAAITDASPTKRYAISVAGGAYSEGATFNIKPNVFIVGAAVGAVRITATTFGMDASFSAGAGVDNRSGYQNVILTGACVFDWSAVTSSAGKLYFTSVSFNSAVTMTGHNNTIAQSQFTSCQFFGTLTVSGINVGVFANNIVFSNIVLNQHPTLATVLQTAGGYCSGTLTATTTVNTFARRISIFARSFWMGAVTVDGPQTYLDHTVDSLPASGATVLNGATLVSIDTGTGADKNLSNLNFPTAVNNPIIPAATDATNFGDWGFEWFWSFAYLHASTGQDCYLISYPSAFGAETGPGKNVFVFADGAGLAANVSGGIVGLYTNNASGTGASGLIEAETGASVNGDTGNIRFTTGTPSGSGRRGTVVINSPLTHPYGTIAVAAPTATALRTNPTYLTSQAAITLPTMLAADDGLRIEIVTTVPSVVTPPSGAANQRAMTTRGGSTWIWINGSTDWFCISAI